MAIDKKSTPGSNWFDGSENRLAEKQHRRPSVTPSIESFASVATSMPRSITFKNETDLLSYEKFLPLSKDHKVTSEVQDHVFQIVDRGNPEFVLAFGMHFMIVKESHRIYDSESKEGRIKHRPDHIFVHEDFINWKNLSRNGVIAYDPFKGYATYYASPITRNIAWTYEQPYEQVQQLKNLITFNPDLVDVQIMT